MNIAVVGLGSMGRRRIRLLRNHFPQMNLYGIDLSAERRKLCEDEYNIPVFTAVSEAVEAVDIECAFICTSPLAHSALIYQFLILGIHIFTELNLVKDGYEENMELARCKGLILFLSSTALYRKETQYIINNVKEGNKIGYTYHVGQYLPDWHPWENYKDFFVQNIRTNGCRELLAIELPWMIKAFGEIESLHAIPKKLTSLLLDYYDTYMIQFVHKNGNMGSMIVDVVSREAVRKLEIFGENTYISWNGTPDSLKVKNLQTKELETIYLYDKIDKLSGYSSTIIENQYLDEMKAFFDELNGIKKADYSFEQDLYTLGIIDKIEEI